MRITNIVQRVNRDLAGENLSYDALVTFLDAVIDDINSKLNAKFPVFSEFNINDHTNYPDYNFFPEKYIRTVVCKGAAYKFFIVDEEGSQTAQQFSYDYKNALFQMERDYLHQVPVEYQETEQGYIEADPIETFAPTTYWD